MAVNDDWEFYRKGILGWVLAVAIAVALVKVLP